MEEKGLVRRGGGRRQGGKKKNKHLARHALQVCHTSLGRKICSQAVSLMPRPRPGRSGGDVGQHPQHGRAQRKLFLFCQEAPQKGGHLQAAAKTSSTKRGRERE